MRAVFTLPLAGRVARRSGAKAGGVGVARLVLKPRDPQPLPAIRAFTPVFDGLWGGAHTACRFRQRQYADIIQQISGRTR